MFTDFYDDIFMITFYKTILLYCNIVKLKIKPNDEKKNDSLLKRVKILYSLWTIIDKLPKIVLYIKPEIAFSKWYNIYSSNIPQR